MSTASATNGSLSISSDLVHVPADLLNTLLSSVESLRNDVSVLQNDISDLRGKNATLSDDVQFLKRTSGASFRYFQKLPIEVRLAIWKFALTAPQIHLFSANRASVSTVSIVMQACKEARDEGLALCLDYYEPESRNPLHRHLAGPRHYMNTEVDTIWMAGEVKSPIGYMMVVSCGRCHVKRFDFRSQCCHKARLGRVAVSTKYWEIPDLAQNTRNGNHNLITMVREMNPREVLIIVSEAPETYEHTFEFVGASGKPMHDWNDPEEAAVATWERKARGEELRLAAFKACKMKQIVENGLARGITMEEMTAADVDGTIPENSWIRHLYKIHSSWELPNVRFVEMNKASWCHLY